MREERERPLHAERPFDRDFHQDEPGHDSSGRVRDRAVVAFAHPQQRLTLLFMDEAKRLIAFRCERSAAEQLAALARQGDRSLSAEIRRAVREHLVSRTDFSAASSHQAPAGAVASHDAAVSAGAPLPTGEEPCDS